ncbi:MarR family transcriptional regulator [Leptospira sp. 96542]|nr:MarR family transcriptional regulator [Leptospira sp. 96542]
MPSKTHRFLSLRFFDRITNHIGLLVEAEFVKLGFKGLTTSHFEILTYLFRKKEPTNMTKLAEAIERTKPTCTVLVVKLESVGLLVRKVSTVDKREWEVNLSPLAISKKKNFYSVSAKLLSLKTWGLVTEEEKKLYPILEKIYNHIKMP